MNNICDKFSCLEKLEVWKKSRNLRIKFSKLSRQLQKEEKFRLSDQIIRSSRSVTANIAEGYGRYHYKESIQYCRQARGSLYELTDHLYVALDDNYIGQDIFNELQDDITETIKILNGYIKYLKGRKDK